MVIYYLYHEYELYEDFMESKEIGFFDSMAEVEDLIKKYQVLPGFDLYPDRFFVQPVLLDNLDDDSTQISEALKTKDIYAVYEVKNCEKYDDEVCSLLGCFTTLSKAEAFAESVKFSYTDVDKDISIEIYDQRIGLKGWCYGFTMWDDSDLDD